MKTIDHITAEITKIKITRDAEIDAKKKELFKIYDDIGGVQKALSNLEMFQDGEYDINEFGELVYIVEVPETLRNLPYLTDYLSYNDANIYPNARKCGSDLSIFQYCGGFISINWRAGVRDVFVYDNDSGETIIEDVPDIEGHPEITTEDYVRAKIEKHMRKKGEFGDVVEINVYGGYSKHFDLRFSFSEDQNLDAVTDEKINWIIETFENREEE